MSERHLPLDFPIEGLNEATEYSLQPAGTTARAGNVRGHETVDGRLRGGSRSGLTRYVPERLNGASVIQHLAVIVDPTVAALLPDFDGEPGTGYLDPTEPARNPFAREVRPGGSGVQPSRGDKVDEEPPGPIALVQSAQVARGGAASNAQLDVTFPAIPATGNLLVVVVFATYVSSGAGYTVSPGGVGTPYDQAGATAEVSFFSSWNSVSIFYRVATSGAGEQTVGVLPADPGTFVVVALEYENTDPGTASVLDGTTGNADEGIVAAWTAGTCPVAPGETGEVVVAAFTSAGVDGTSLFTLGAGYTARESHPEGVTDLTDLFAVVADKLGVSADDEPTATFTNGQPYAAVAASFKWAGP